MATRKIKIRYNGYVSPIRMNGPIVTPITVDERVALNLVSNGYKTFEIDPITKKEIRLTIENFSDKNRFGTDQKSKSVNVTIKPETKEVKPEVKVEVPVTPVKEEKKEEVKETKVETTEEVDIDVNDTNSNKTYNYNNKKNKK